MYEITLQGSPPASLTARFPAIKWHLASAATIFSARGRSGGGGQAGTMRDPAESRPRQFGGLLGIAGAVALARDGIQVDRVVQCATTRRD